MNGKYKNSAQCRKQILVFMRSYLFNVWNYHFMNWCLPVVWSCKTYKTLCFENLYVLITDVFGTSNCINLYVNRISISFFCLKHFCLILSVELGKCNATTIYTIHNLLHWKNSVYFKVYFSKSIIMKIFGSI